MKSRRAQTVEDEETWVDGDVSPTVNIFDTGDVRATTLIANSGIVQSLDVKQGGPDDNEAQAGHLIIAATLNAGGNKGGFRTEPGEHPLPSGADGEEDPLLPPGLDSNRYRACGNAVVVNVAEWIGHRLRHALEDA